MSNLGDALENEIRKEIRNEIRKEIFNESYEEIRKKVKREVDKKFSINLYKDGYTLEQIADIGELSVDEVKELVSENKPVNE